MIRSAFRLLGLILLAGAFAALIIDGTRSIAGGEFTVTSVAAALLWAMPDRLDSFRQQVQHVNPYLWDPILIYALRLPLWSIAGCLGFLAIAASKRKQAKIGYSSRD
jgi:hypothetical protein